MKAICTHDCQFRGVLVKADTILDVSEEEAKTDLVKSSFRPLEGAAPKRKEEDKPDERGMTAADYRAKRLAKENNRVGVGKWEKAGLRAD